MIFKLMLGFYCALSISVIAWWRKSLDVGGMIAATISGTVIFGLGGVGPSVALVAFFLSGSLLSKLPQSRSNLPPVETHGRTWRQVAANGLVPMLAIVGAYLLSRWEFIFMAAYYGAIATSCADTWGTEFGTRFGKQPIDVLTGQAVERGLSGGISIAGSAASLAGSAFIVCAAVVPIGSGPSTHRPMILIAIVVAGMLGSMCDSVLGSSMQAKYPSLANGQLTETPAIQNGIKMELRPLFGYKKITNNAVNLISSLFGAFFSALMIGF
jgi:uncharacterized protein (TIGR00297 family)